MDGTIKIEYKLSDTIEDSWSEHDKVITRIHLQRFGKIVLDEYGLPIDNEFLLEELESILKTE